MQDLLAPSTPPIHSISEFNFGDSENTAIGSADIQGRRIKPNPYRRIGMRLDLRLFHAKTVNHRELRMLPNETFNAEIHNADVRYVLDQEHGAARLDPS